MQDNEMPATTVEAYNPVRGIWTPKANMNTSRKYGYACVLNNMIYIIEGQGALVNENGEETLLKAGDFALVNPDEKHQYRNKGDRSFQMICRVPKEFEQIQ